MEVIKTVSEFFLLSLGFGTGFFTFLVPTKYTGVGFLKLIMTVVFGATLLGIILLFSSSISISSPLMIGLYGIVALLAFQYANHKDQKSPTMWGMFILQQIIYIGALYYFSEAKVQNFAFMLLSALYLGIVNYSMLLGHYYLVVPRLSEKPLLNANMIFWGLLAIRVVLSLKSTLDHNSFFEAGSVDGQGYMFNWIILSMRWLWGYLAVFVLSVFNWKLCKMRSIQSATGVLYVMVFFTLIGELISAYMFLNYGLAI